MDLDRYKEDILQKQYEEYVSNGRELLDEGNKQKAAVAFSKAAARREELQNIRDADYTDELAKLRGAAEKLKQGEDIQTTADTAEDTTKTTDSREKSDEDYKSQVESFISQTDSKWEDIGGLEDVKSELKRAIALGAISEKPDAVAATDRVLLFGPPGTGKTLLASAVAGSLDATFFDVKLGGLLSKYYGETSKQITALFDLAREMSPSIIFLDEIDALTQSRDSDLDETSRRVLNTLLSELDGIDKGSEDFVMVLGATNTPWDLDQAIRRRFPARIHIPLPDVASAKEIVRIHTTKGGVSFEGSAQAYDFSNSASVPDSPIAAIAAQCVEHEFTGSDIEALCRTAINSMVNRSNKDLESLADEGFEAISSYDVTIDSIRPEDFQTAFETTTASLSTESVQRFTEWNSQYGTGS